MLAQLSQHRPCRVAERVPAHAGDPDLLERGPDFPLQDRGQIESPSTTVEPRREHEIRRLRAVTLRSPFQQSQLQCWMHRERLRGSFRFRAFQNAAVPPVVGMLNLKSVVFQSRSPAIAKPQVHPGAFPVRHPKAPTIDPGTQAS